ncbi:hypothetical protein GE09DRAFT_354503 [Coniochaeta sp. 2T2.1]|nr:hypothetical protein GE09DRAFT_354503 [Coniochaeta sp. 2T2.1]
MRSHTCKRWATVLPARFFFPDFCCRLKCLMHHAEIGKQMLLHRAESCQAASSAVQQFAQSRVGKVVQVRYLDSSAEPPWKVPLQHSNALRVPVTGKSKPACMHAAIYPDCRANEGPMVPRSVVLFSFSLLGVAQEPLSTYSQVIPFVTNCDFYPDEPKSRWKYTGRIQTRLQAENALAVETWTSIIYYTLPKRNYRGHLSGSPTRQGAKRPVPRTELTTYCTTVNMCCRQRTQCREMPAASHPSLRTARTRLHRQPTRFEASPSGAGKKDGSGGQWASEGQKEAQGAIPEACC